MSHRADQSENAPRGSRAGPSEFVRPTQSVDLTPLLTGLLCGATLTAAQSATAFEAMMSGQVHPGEIGALLALLATRVPTSEELLGAAQVMRSHVDPVPFAGDPAELVDTAGTGGAPKTFNVSTAAALVAAAAGARVAKHGNRSRTGRGSAEALAALGVDVDADRATQARCLEGAGVCFCFAVHHHPATRHVMPVRRALGFPTIFNLLGPLTNPAGARRQVLGVYHADFLRPMAEALAALGAVRAMVMHSDDGLDELSIAAPSMILHVDGGRGVIREERIDPASLGLAPAPLEAVTATDLDHAVAMVRGVLQGTLLGPARDMTVLNAAAAIVVAGLAETFEEGLERAACAIDSGAAHRRLQQLVEVSHGRGDADE